MRPWLQGRFAQAEQKFLQMRAEVPGNFNTSILVWQSEMEMERGRFAAAAALLNEAKKANAPDIRGMAQRRFGCLLLSVGRFSEAEKNALEDRRWDGDVHTLKLKFPMDLVTLGEVFLIGGRFSEAIQIFQQAQALAKKVSSIDGYEWFRAQVNIAFAYLEMGQLELAAEASQRALAEADREWGTPSIPVMDALDVMGAVQLARSDLKSAAESLSRSMQARESLYGPRHPKVAESYMHAAMLSWAEGNRDEAIRLTSESLAVEQSLAAGGPNARWAMARLAAAELLTKAGEANDALDCYQSAIPILERELGSDTPRVAEARKRFSALSGQ